jgi:hypothetical protein
MMDLDRMGCRYQEHYLYQNRYRCSLLYKTSDEDDFDLPDTYIDALNIGFIMRLNEKTECPVVPGCTGMGSHA